MFGYSYGHKPAYVLKSKSISAVNLFVNKGKKTQTFRIDSIEAGGEAGEKPPIDPKSIRVVPKDGIILGPTAPIDPDKQIETHDAKAEALDGGTALHVLFPASGKESSASIKPPIGKWDLHNDLQVRVKVKNDGTGAVSPKVRVESEWNPGDWASAGEIAPGAEAEITAPFISAKIWDGSKGTGNRVSPDEVSAITFTADAGSAERSIRVISVIAEMPPTPALPEWLGKRPPVEGNWTKTFDDEFDGTSLDASKWNVKGENYYDKVSHWSAENVIVSGGYARLHFEKKTGHQNDDPKRNETPYATGFLDSLDKFAQRYGYFESRMKLPTAPGLWPAFWLMPDRGRNFNPKWQRTATEVGGMEFDIMEHLTRWGPTRYNIAMHWDGYGKDHKALGSEKIYVQPDKDGFITAGVLITPGSAVYYCNGKEVLRWENPRVSAVPEYMMFTMPSGGWDNNALDDAKLPADLVIDYVRVWQRADLAAGPTTAPANKVPAE
jgi:beta-glucanase (GH16 family)